MSFAWPFALPLLALPLLLAGAYLWSLRRRRRHAVRHPQIALVRAALPPRARWRPHLPVALFLLAVTALALAVARPQAAVDVPQQRTAIILALDVSRSMCSTDVPPNRLTAARDAVRAFVEQQPEDQRIGLVLFSGFSALTVPPTTDRDPLRRSLDGLTTGRGTAIGSALLTSLDAIAAINPQVPQVGPVPAPPAPGARAPVPTGPVPTPPGATEGYVSDIVVLLTDGANTRGVLPLDAATLAAERRVRVYPIGFGTRNPGQMACTAAQLGGDVFGEFGPRGNLPPDVGGGGGGNWRNFLAVDEPTLRRVADTTGGSYHPAADAQQLTQVLADLPRDVVMQREQRELTGWLAALAALLVAGALALTVRWNPTA